MTLALLLCLIATVIPVFFGKIGAAPVWLSLQALALGWVTLKHHEDVSLHALLAGLELLLVRAWLVPALLRRLLAGQARARLDLMPSNLFTWGIAVSLIILAFKFGEGARVDVRALTLGVMAASVMIALLILSTNQEPTAQLVALLFMENALALFESLMPEPWPLLVHIALSGVYLATVLMGLWLLSDAPVPEVDAPEALKEAA
jgi:hydrogenase-4 membrane subunit HyfE